MTNNVCSDFVLGKLWIFQLIIQVIKWFTICLSYYLDTLILHRQFLFYFILLLYKSAKFPSSIKAMKSKQSSLGLERQSISEKHTLLMEKIHSSPLHHVADRYLSFQLFSLFWLPQALGTCIFHKKKYTQAHHSCTIHKILKKKVMLASLGFVGSWIITF